MAQIGSDWLNGFNTQPPEGGWVSCEVQIDSFFRFQHTAARGRLVVIIVAIMRKLAFQHTAARGRLATKIALLGIA